MGRHKTVVVEEDTDDKPRYIDKALRSDQKREAEARDKITLSPTLDEWLKRPIP